MIENVIQGLIEYNPNNKHNDFRCGNSKFSDNVWDFKGFIDAPHWAPAKFKLNFKPFSNWSSIQNTIKQFIVTELLAVGFNSVKRKLASFNQLHKFLNENKQIDSFQDFSKPVLVNYFKYLLMAKSERDGSLLNGVSIKKSAQVIKELLIRGGVKDWNVNKKNTYVAAIYEKMILQSPRIKADTSFDKVRKVLPEEYLVNKIIELAQVEPDVLAGASIVLQTQLGIRISEVVTLKENCMRVIGGEMHIEYTTSKTKKESISVIKPANELVVHAVQRLLENNKQIRQDSNLPYLYLIKYNGKFVISSHSNWTRGRLDPFIKKHGIRDNDGKLLRLTSHYFRHIFATYAIKNGMPIYEVAEMMNHDSIQMTEAYSHVKEHLKQVMVDVLSGDMPVAGTNRAVLEAIESDQNPFRGKTTDQADKMRRSMKIEILPHGLCLHHPLRGEPCAQDGVCLGCNNFLAPSSLLPQYEARLARVNKELQSQSCDQNIYTSKLRYQAGRLEYYVKELSEKVAKRQIMSGLREVAISSDGK